MNLTEVLFRPNDVQCLAQNSFQNPDKVLMVLPEVNSCGQTGQVNLYATRYTSIYLPYHCRCHLAINRESLVEEHSCSLHAHTHNAWATWSRVCFSDMNNISNNTPSMRIASLIPTHIRVTTKYGESIISLFVCVFNFMCTTNLRVHSPSIFKTELPWHPVRNRAKEGF
jgi:hypothetical protein